MNRNACALVSTVVVTASAYAGFYFLSRPLLHAFGISEYAHGVALLGLLAVCIASVVVGSVVGFFLFPAVLRPFTSAEDFWGWIGSSRSITLPYLDPLLERWAAVLYGARPHAHARKH
jgi:hypothetical protein